MKLRLLEMVNCPGCAGDLALKGCRPPQDDARVEGGTLACNSCGHEYEIVNGVPFFNPEARDVSLTARSFSDQWDRRRRGLFEKKGVFGFSENEYVAHFCYAFNIQDLRRLQGVVVEAGIGSGCLVTALAKNAPRAEVIGMDISESVAALSSVADQLPNLHLIQCDLLKPPVRKRVADKVYSSGVIHHLEKPFEGVASLWSLVRKGGQLYFWIYPDYLFCAYDGLRRLLRAPFKWSGRTRFAVSWLLAPSMWLYFATTKRYSCGRSRESLRTVAFRIFDNLSPEFQHRTSKEEVGSWCESLGIRDFQVREDLGVACTRDS